MKRTEVEANRESANIMNGGRNNSKQSNWWTYEMTKLKIELKKARLDEKLWHNEETKRNVKTAKRNFRREQRRCVFVYEEKRNINIENLFDKPTKEDFW